MLNIVGKNFKVEVYREDDGEVVATKSFVKPSVKHLMEEINALKAKYIVYYARAY